MKNWINYISIKLLFKKKTRYGLAYHIISKLARVDAYVRKLSWPGYDNGIDKAHIYKCV